MNQMNGVWLQGRMVSDPELKVLSADNQVCKFRMVFNRRRRDEGGNYQNVEESYWDVEVWGWMAGKAANLAKGSPILVMGRMGVDSWKDRETGAPRSKPLIKCDAVYVDLGGVRDIESGRGFLSLSWGKDRPAAVDNGVEQMVGQSWNEDPF